MTGRITNLCASLLNAVCLLLALTTHGHAQTPPQPAATSASAAADTRPTWELIPPPLTMGAMTPPLMRPFKDGRTWVLGQALQYNIGNSSESITVPVGFVTDFASIPQPFWSFGLSPTGQYNLAAIIHDYLYWSQSCTRQQSDRLFLLAMKESGVDTLVRGIVFGGVRIGGNAAWKKNEQEREAGQTRYFTPSSERRLGIPQLMAMLAWDDIRPLVSNKEPIRSPTRTYCKFGDSTEVPSSPETSGAQQK